MKHLLTLTLFLLANYQVFSQKPPSLYPPESNTSTSLLLVSNEKTNKNHEELSDTSLSCGENLIIHKGIIYNSVFYKGKCWLDRNLGANRPAKSVNDPESYGSYFQWGRFMDGHENPESSISNLLSGINNPGLVLL